jgi:two-component system cell cycle sensor histidine kinase/response regulator CckA
MQEPMRLSRVNRPAKTVTNADPLQFPHARLGNRRTLREEGGDALALAGITHDARNLVTALGLCAELMSQPGVLAPKHGHFSAEIRSIAESSGQLVQRLSELCRKTAQTKEAPIPEAAVADLSESVEKMRSLLGAIAGPVANLQISCLPCGGPLRLTQESLSRILVNLVRNATDAIPTGGRIRITTQRGGGTSFLWTMDTEGTEEGAECPLSDSPHGAGAGPQTVQLTVEDDGPGIPAEFLERVFDSGFTTRGARRSWPESQHHGLGLSIVRELVEAAGGTIRAANAPLSGARFEIELPITNVIPNLLSEPAFDVRIDPQ